MAQYFTQIGNLLTILLLLQTVPTGIAVGSHVWVEDPEVAWIDGVVLEVDGEAIKVDCTSGKTVSTAFVYLSCSCH